MSTFPPTPGFINSLDPANPINADFVYGSDDWHRFKQQVIKNQFPKDESGGNTGWSIECTAKCSEVNTLTGINTGTDLETRLANIEALLDTVVPIGRIVAWPLAESLLTQTLTGTNAPGIGTWHWCDGSVLDGSTTYSTLYSKILNQYGGTSGTDMQIPKIQGQVIAGRGTGTVLTGYRQGVNDSTQGNTGGEQAHTPTIGETASHDHGGGDHAHNLNYAANSGTNPFNTASSFALSAGGTNYMSTGVSGNRSGMAASSGAVITSNGGDENFNVVQPTIILAFYIRVL